MIPAAVGAGLADAVDAFCEGIGFTADECARVFEARTRNGLALRLHADQFSDLGGAAALAARFGAPARSRRRESRIAGKGCIPDPGPSPFDPHPGNPRLSAAERWRSSRVTHPRRPTPSTNLVTSTTLDHVETSPRGP